MILGPNQVQHGRTDDTLEARSQEPGKTAVAVQDGVVTAENSGAFVHPLHENTVGMIGPLQREHFLPALAVHNNSIHFAGTNGTEGFLGFAQACDQFPARKGPQFLGPAVILLVSQPFSAFRQLLLPHSQVQSAEHFFWVRQGSNEPAQRRREPFNERGHRHNLLVSGQIRLLVNVDDFQVIPILQVLLTNPLDILYSQRRFQRGSAYIQTQDVLCLARMGAGSLQFPGQSEFPLSCRAALFRGEFHVGPPELGQSTFRRSRPTNSRTLLDRSPTIVRSGSGSLLTRVGIATIWSLRASCGFSLRSITSI